MVHSVFKLKWKNDLTKVLPSHSHTASEAERPLIVIEVIIFSPDDKTPVIR